MLSDELASQSEESLSDLYAVALAPLFGPAFGFGDLRSAPGEEQDIVRVR